MRRSALLLLSIALGGAVAVTLMAIAGSKLAPGGRSTADSAAADPDATLLTCVDGAARRSARGDVVNNAWNRTSAGSGPWRQCLQSRHRDGRTEYGWTWHWPTRDGIYAYPEQLIGRSPWGSVPSNDPRFPIRVDAVRKMQIDYDLETRSSGKQNLALEFWLTDSAVSASAASADRIRAELMIVTDESAGISPKSDPTDQQVIIEGREWIVRVRPGWGDASGGSNHQWLFITYRALTNRSAEQYDARRMIQHAVDSGWVDAKWMLEGVELGNEIISGSGSTWVRRFDVTIE